MRRPGPRSDSTRAPPRACRLPRRRGRRRRARGRAGGAWGSGYGRAAPARDIRTRCRTAQDSNDCLDQPRDFGDIAVHLLDEGIRRLETSLAADAVEELQAQLAAVEV